MITRKDEEYKSFGGLEILGVTNPSNKFEEVKSQWLRILQNVGKMV